MTPERIEANTNPSSADKLTLLLKDTLRLVALGLTNPEISNKAEASLGAIENRLHKLYEIFDINGKTPGGRHSLALKAVELGLASQKETKLSLREFSLTKHQLKILKLVALGFSYQKVGARLEISPFTVKKHLWSKERPRGIFTRLKASSIREAVVKAAFFDFLDPEELVTGEELEKCKQLSEHQLDVLSSLASPLLSSTKTTYVEIAESLGITTSAVERHLRKIYKTLDIDLGPFLNSARAAVIFMAFERQLILPSHETFH